MKQKLEQVIDEFWTKCEEADAKYGDRQNDRREYYEGYGDALEMVVSKLREVIRSDEPDATSKQHAPES